MKKHGILTILGAVLLLGSCGDNETIEIDSLQVFGDEFFQGEVVNLGMAVKTSNPNKNYYKWWCEAGTLQVAQDGYTVMRWTAPKENGEYLITCTVSCGNAKQTREVLAKVNGVFFDRFSGKTPAGWSVTNQNATIRSTLGRLETTLQPGQVGTSDYGVVTRGMGVSQFAPPLSLTANVGIETIYSTKPYPTTPSTPTADNFMGYGMTGNRPDDETAPTYYISEIRLDWWPVDTHAQPTIEYHSAFDDNVLETINANEFNARIYVKWIRRADTEAGIPQREGEFMTFFTANEFNFDMDTDYNIGISMEEDYTLKVFVDTQEVFSTTDISTWRESHDNAVFWANQVRYLYPALITVYLDDVVANNSTELLF